MCDFPLGLVKQSTLGLLTSVRVGCDNSHLSATLSRLTAAHVSGIPRTSESPVENGLFFNIFSRFFPVVVSDERTCINPKFNISLKFSRR